LKVFEEDVETVAVTSPFSETIKSVNQEIYKQIRHSLDQTMKDYREKNPINIDQVVTNLQESEEREKDKR
jgi:hypothetical protein